MLRLQTAEGKRWEYLKTSVPDVTFVSVSQETAHVEVQDVIAAVRPNTCLISIMLANNETGVIMVRVFMSQHMCSYTSILNLFEPFLYFSAHPGDL